MNNYICCSFISPVSDYNFDKNYKPDYFLVFISTNTQNNISISKTKIKKIDNVNNSVRAFGIHKCFEIEPFIFGANFTIKIFEHNKLSNKLILLFTGNLKVEDYEFHNKSYVRLNTPAKINNKDRSLKVNGDNVFLNEKFFNYQNLYQKNNQYCLLFFTKTKYPIYSVTKPLKIKFDIAKEDTYIYDRYNNNVIKEYVTEEVRDKIRYNSKPYFTPQKKHFINVLDFLSKYCNKKGNYQKYIEDYFIDTQCYIKHSPDSHSHYKKMKNGYRPIKFEPHINNLLLSPVDGRVRGFFIDPTLKLSIYNKTFELKNLIPKPFEFFDEENGIYGSGAFFRMCPQDYKGVYVPYSGYLTEIGFHGPKNSKSLTDKPYIVTLRIESDYFIAPSTHERDYAAVMNGNFIHTGVGVGAGNRYYPELLKTQPDDRLIYYLILVGSPIKDSIKFISPKLFNIRRIVTLNSIQRIKPTWLQQGEEIAQTFCGGGILIMISNRSIDFTKDIRYYSKIDTNNLHKPIDVLIKGRDILGALN